MGADIHVYVEEKVNNIWRPLMKEDPDYLKDEWATEQFVYDWIDVPRDYKLFALLAGVRNHDDWQPLFANRGLPEDVSSELKQISDEYTDGHSHTWFGLNELIEMNSNEYYENVKRWVNIHDYNKYINNKIKPSSFNYQPTRGKIELTWRLTYVDILGEFVNTLLNGITGISSNENVRIIIWFDN